MRSWSTPVLPNGAAHQMGHRIPQSDPCLGPNESGSDLVNVEASSNAIKRWMGLLVLSVSTPSWADLERRLVVSEPYRVMGFWHRQVTMFSERDFSLIRNFSIRYTLDGVEAHLTCHEFSIPCLIDTLPDQSFRLLDEDEDVWYELYSGQNYFQDAVYTYSTAPQPTSTSLSSVVFNQDVVVDHFDQLVTEGHHRVQHALDLIRTQRPVLSLLVSTETQALVVPVRQWPVAASVSFGNQQDTALGVIGGWNDHYGDINTSVSAALDWVDSQSQSFTAGGELWWVNEQSSGPIAQINHLTMDRQSQAVGGLRVGPSTLSQWQSKLGYRHTRGVPMPWGAMTMEVTIGGQWERRHVTGVVSNGLASNALAGGGNQTQAFATAHLWGQTPSQRVGLSLHAQPSHLSLGLNVVW